MKSNLNLILLIIFSLFGCNNLISQHNNTFENKQENMEINTPIECEKGKRAAEKDYQNDDWGLYLENARSGPRFNTWVRLIREVYNLKIKRDLSYKEGNCYNQIMIEKIKAKFGQDVFETITSQLDSLYEIDLGDRNAAFKGGERELLKYIYCNIASDLLSRNGDEIPRIIVQISIDEKGKVMNEGIRYKNKFAETNDSYEAEANKIINNMPDWIPAIENKKTIPFKAYYLPIIFGKEMKNKDCD